jgi:YjbE family integral membrane protein
MRARLAAASIVRMDASQFLSALLAIVVIDIVLAGDNAIVIALAARALPAHLQKRAIVWGAVGAIAVRSLMTVIVVWLLKIPGLLLAGGLLLVWIGYRLLLPEGGEDGERGPAATTFWGAMRTIVIADAVMGLDNVLAVAGAAHGSYLLVVAGLAISVPIVVWGSRLVLKVVDRYPSVVYFGAAVLVWTATKMILAEPLLKEWFATAAPVAPALVYALIPAVLWAGFVKNHRQLESRIHARLARFGPARPALPIEAQPWADETMPGVHAPGGAVVSAAADGAGPDATAAEALASVGPARDAPQPAAATAPAVIEEPVLKVLVPVDGGPNALRAVRHAVDEYRRHHEVEVHLLNVQPRLSRHITRFVARADRDAWLGDRAQVAMGPASAVLEAAGVPYRTHWAAGNRALAICNRARDLGVHHILMSTARKNSLTRMLEDSVTHRVLESTPVPVEVIAGDAVSKWERWGLPAGVIGAGGLLLWAAD